LCELAPERLGVDEVDELALAVDLDDRNPLPVAILELRGAVDRDLLELEAELLTKRVYRRPGPLAEMAVRRVVEPY
jgi:hypothetical protein